MHPLGTASRGGRDGLHGRRGRAVRAVIGKARGQRVNTRGLGEGKVATKVMTSLPLLRLDNNHSVSCWGCEWAFMMHCTPIIRCCSRVCGILKHKAISRYCWVLQCYGSTLWSQLQSPVTFCLCGCERAAILLHLNIGSCRCWRSVIKYIQLHSIKIWWHKLAGVIFSLFLSWIVD